MRFFVKLLVFVLVPFVASADPSGGSVVGNGGNGFAIEFRNLGRSIAENLERSRDFDFDARRFRQAVETTTIETQERVFLGGREVGAANFPQLGKIVVNERMWLITSRSVIPAVSLVMHEFLGMMGIQNDRLVNRYVQKYVRTFAKDEPAPPEEVLRCDLALGAPDASRRFPLADQGRFTYLGARNLSILKQFDKYWIFVEDNVVARSMQTRTKIPRFLGYFDCHFSPTGTDWFCTQSPCSSVKLSFDRQRQLVHALISVDRITDSCKAKAVGLHTEEYLKAQMVYPPSSCRSTKSSFTRR